MSVLLLQMAHTEDVEDLVGLDGALLEAAEVNPVLSSNAGEGTSATPAPTVAGEGPAPAPAPTSEGDPSSAKADFPLPLPPVTSVSIISAPHTVPHGYRQKYS